MSRLEKRLERLEGAGRDEILVWLRFPEGTPMHRRKEMAEAAARERGHAPPFRIERDDWPAERVTVMFIGPGAVLRAAIKSIQERNRHEPEASA